MGHSFENAVDPSGLNLPRNALSTNMSENRNGLARPLWKWQQSKDISALEIFADMFLGWVYNEWDFADYPAEAGDRKNFMILYMPYWTAHTMP
jgi:hypothetical protein